MYCSCQQPGLCIFYTTGSLKQNLFQNFQTFRVQTCEVLELLVVWFSSIVLWNKNITAAWYHHMATGSCIQKYHTNASWVRSSCVKNKVLNSAHLLHCPLSVTFRILSASQRFHILRQQNGHKQWRQNHHKSLFWPSTSFSPAILPKVHRYWTPSSPSSAVQIVPLTYI